MFSPSASHSSKMELRLSWIRITISSAFSGLSLPTAFNLNASGYVANLTDPSNLKADLKLKGNTDNLDFVTAMLSPDGNREVKIPRGIGIDGTFKANGPVYGADFTATEGGGTLKANVALDSKRMKYSTTLDAKQFPLQHFLPNMGLSPISAYLEADGVGTDIMSKSTSLRAKANIQHFKYGGYDFDGMNRNPIEFTITNHSKKPIDYKLKVENDQDKQNNCIIDGSVCPQLSTNYIRYSYKIKIIQKVSGII